MCAVYPDLLKYVEGTILDQVKEKIVCAWTDQVPHFGNITTTKVESTHARLKTWLENNKGDFYRDWDTANRFLQNQHNKIRTSFGRIIILLEY